MITVTHEMIQAYADASDPWADPDEQAKGRIAAVLAIVERDYRLIPLCTEELVPGVHCARPAHVRGDHEAKLPTGNAVKWS